MTKGAKIDCADESLLKSAEIFAADMNTVLGVQIPVAVNNGGNIMVILAGINDIARNNIEKAS